MAKNRYYLFARNKDTNKVVPVYLSEDDIYKNGDKNCFNYNSLEEIDVFTTSYGGEEEVIKYLINTNKLDNKSYDLFIVSRNGSEYNYMEILYNSTCLLSEIRAVAFSILKKGDFVYHNDVILNNFIELMSNKKFRKYIESKYHNIYTLFIKYFDGCYGSSKMYQVKYRDGAWALKSYVLLRNIIEAINRFGEIKKDKSTKDIALAAKKYKEKLENVRNKSAADIMFYTEKNYKANQLSIFDDDDTIDKLSELESFIDLIDFNVFELFSINCNMERVIVNRDAFQCSDTEYDRLSELDQILMRSLYNYLNYKEFAKNHCDIDGFINKKKNQIIKLIADDKNLLDNFYAFYLLYKKIKERNNSGSLSLKNV